MQKICDRGERGDYDIVFMDHLMPGMDGIEAAAKIRALGGHYAASPIIALTANALTGMREMYLENGFDDFLAKLEKTGAACAGEISRLILAADYDGAIGYCASLLTR